MGVLALAALLGFMGAGFVLGGAYLVVAGEVGWVAAAAAGAGPVLLYVALHLVRLTRWSWSALVLLFVLLILSSAARALGGGGDVAVPLVELGVELACLAYLLRPRIRRAFGRR